MMEDGGDVAATKFKWSILVLCGDPAKPEHKAKWHPETTADGWFSAPDNVSFDPSGRLWISTDQGTSWGRSCRARPTGSMRWKLPATNAACRSCSSAVPVGAEMCGPRFTRDGTTLFLAVQHPSADGTADYKPFGKASSFEDPATRWPDFQARHAAASGGGRRHQAGRRPDRVICARAGRARLTRPEPALLEAIDRALRRGAARVSYLRANAATPCYLVTDGTMMPAN